MYDMEPRSAPPVGVLLIGPGAVARQHLNALEARTDVVLSGVVDIDEARAAEAAKSAGGVRWTTDLAEALSWPEVDACVVCTPNDTHVEVGTTIAKARKHLLIEKPLAITVFGAYRLVDEFERSGRVLMSAHTHRHYDYSRSVKAVLDSGDIGEPVLVRLALLGGWIWPDWRGWMLDSARSGGHSLHNGVHVLDVVRWWIGDTPVSVQARGQRQTASALDIADYLEIVVRFERGAVAICEMSRAHRPASASHRDVLVVGTDGRLALEWDGEGGLIVDERGMAPLPAATSDGFAVQLDAFLAAVRGAEPAMSPADGALAVAMGVAAERSIANGDTVLLADVLEEAR